MEMNIQKSVMFLYTNNELFNKEINNSIYNCIKKRIKYIGINLTKKVKDLYAENYKTVMKKVKENTIKQKYNLPIFIDWKT